VRGQETPDQRIETIEGWKAVPGPVPYFGRGVLQRDQARGPLLPRAAGCSQCEMFHPGPRPQASIETSPGHGQASVIRMHAQRAHHFVVARADDEIEVDPTLGLEALLAQHAQGLLHVDRGESASEVASCQGESLHCRARVLRRHRPQEALELVATQTPGREGAEVEGLFVEFLLVPTCSHAQTLAHEPGAGIAEEAREFLELDAYARIAPGRGRHLDVDPSRRARTVRPRGDERPPWPVPRDGRS
jgi:hypothetical protein